MFEGLWFYGQETSSHWDVGRNRNTWSDVSRSFHVVLREQIAVWRKSPFRKPCSSLLASTCWSFGTTLSTIGCFNTLHLQTAAFVPADSSTLCHQRHSCVTEPDSRCLSHPYSLRPGEFKRYLWKRRRITWFAYGFCSPVWLNVKSYFRNSITAAPFEMCRRMKRRFNCRNVFFFGRVWRGIEKKRERESEAVVTVTLDSHPVCPGWTLRLSPPIWVKPSAPYHAVHCSAFQTALLRHQSPLERGRIEGGGGVKKKVSRTDGKEKCLFSW